MLNRTFQFRLYPSKTHVRLLTQQLHLCQQLYNALLEQWASAWSRRKKGLSGYDQMNELPELKRVCPEYKGVHSQVLQQVVRQREKASKAFFGRVKSGKIPGYPRFKSRDRYDTLTFVQNSFGYDGKHLRLSKVGHIKVKAYRKFPEEFEIKQAVITRKADGWYISFQCEIPNPKSLPETGRAVGIDVGIRNLVTTSTGEILGDLGALGRKHQQVQQAQRVVSRRKKGSNRRRKAVGILRRRHLELSRARKAQLDIISKKLVEENDVICVENLQIRRMQKKVKSDNKRGIRRGNSDAAYAQLFHMCAYKAEEAGRVFLRVNPKNTSQLCSRCGTLVPKSLDVRIHWCPDCGLMCNRDHNSAMEVLNRGLQLLRDNDMGISIPLLLREDHLNFRRVAASVA